MPPLASIIINNYNYGRFLREATDSALGQTYDRVEVIVVDDGSTDNSREIISNYGDRIRPVLKANGGQASAFNSGFRISNGDLILFLDADDMLEATAIEEVVRAWQPGIADLYFLLQVINENGEPRGDLIGGNAPPVPDPLVGPFLSGSPSSGNVYLRGVLERIMPIPEEGWRICADLCVNNGSLLFGEARCLGKPLGKYRIHGNNSYACMGGLARLRRHIDLDFKLYDVLFRLSNGEIGTREDWLGTSPRHWIRRIASLRQDPSSHPWPDTFPALTARAVKASLRQPWRSMHERLASAIFAFGYGLLPGKVILGLKKMARGVEGNEHVRTLRRVIGA